MKASACGKCVLLGEHSVIEGGGAISLPLHALTLQITFEAGPRNNLILDVDADLQLSHELFWKLLSRDFSDVPHQGSYKIASNIPLGAGLGSSGALAVALHRLHRPGITLDQLVVKACESENLFHGQSSGMDPTTSAAAQILYFESPAKFEKQSIAHELADNYVLTLVDSGVRRSSKGAILDLRGLRETDPDRWQSLIADLQSFVAGGRSALASGNARELGSLMNNANDSLKMLGVSHDETESLRARLLGMGALGSKLTGAGRGGFVLSLFEKELWLALKSRDEPELLKFFELRL